MAYSMEVQVMDRDSTNVMLLLTSAVCLNRSFKSISYLGTLCVCVRVCVCAYVREMNKHYTACTHMNTIYLNGLQQQGI